jgi:prolyl-tRNA editing enzyme YbaK/EbsC (Cys-tRNA(Pro) deacylase)
MSIAASVQKALRDLEADFDVLSIDPDLADTGAFCARYGYALEDSANAILIASKRPAGHHAVCVALATTRLDVNHSVRDQMGVKKLSFASPDLTMEITGMMIGGVTPFGLPAGLDVLVDAAVVQRSRVVIGGGDRASKIHLDPEVFERLAYARVVPGLAQPTG